MRRLFKAILVLLVVVSAGTTTSPVFSQDGPADARSSLEATIAALIPGLTRQEVDVLISEGEITNMY
ncbi:MAG: hypothetical protein KOO61_02860, partial [Spirochaetales bacterium]|nr:hypothetical protein [Spirochaetales bacterium]